MTDRDYQAIEQKLRVYNELHNKFKSMSEEERWKYDAYGLYINLIHEIEDIQLSGMEIITMGLLNDPKAKDLASKLKNISDIVNE